MEAHSHNYKVQKHHDGSITVGLRDGSIVELGADGNISATLPVITAVGIKNLGEVESHAITTIAGSRSHVVKFTNGGLLQFAFNNQSEIIELSASKLQGMLVNGNEMVYSML
ncbi:MAG: hypothetical protein ACXWJK_14030 [Burkholderiaceae bacterium]